MAFFPCVRFNGTIPLSFRGEAYQQKNWSDEKKLNYSIKLHEQLNLLYTRLSQLVLICIHKGLKLVIENPYSQPHYLTAYWCIKPKVIDKDRTLNGDYYKKPTQYWFVNLEPKNNILLESVEHVPNEECGSDTMSCAKCWNTEVGE